MSNQELAALAIELEMLKRLLEKTQGRRQRHLLHHRAWSLLRRARQTEEV